MNTRRDMMWFVVGGLANDLRFNAATGAPEFAGLLAAPTVPSQSAIGGQLWPQTSLESGAGVTPMNFAYPPGDVRRYGAVGDGNATGGGTNNAAALQNALNCGHKAVYLPAGVYRCDSALTLADGVSFLGDGSKSVIDGTNVPYVGPGQKAIVQIIGTGLTSLGSPDANPVKHTKQLSFAAPPPVSPRDVLVIYNPTDGSWSGFRPYYREGEFCQVRDLLLSTINLTSYLYSGYTAAKVTVYRMAGASGAVRNMKVIAPVNSTGAVLVRFGTFVDLCGLDCVGSDHALIMIERSYNVRVSGCYVAHLQTAVSRTDYAVSVANSQHVRCESSHLVARRHAFVTGGGDFIGAVPCRDVRVHNSTCISTSTDIDAINTHGNGEFIEISNVLADGGATLSGDNITVRDSVLRGGGNLGTVILLAEMKGWNFTFDGLEIHARGGGAASRGAAFDADAATSNTTRGGTLLLRNLRIVDDAASALSDWEMVIRNQGSAVTYDVMLENITLEVADGTTATLLAGAFAGSAPRKIRVTNLRANVAALQFGDVGSLDIDNVDIDAAVTGKDGINAVISVNDSVVRVRGVQIKAPARNGISVIGVGTTGVVARAENNTVLNTVSRFYGIELHSVATAIFTGNHCAGTGTGLRADTVATMIGLGNTSAVSKSSVTTDIEIGSDGADIVVPGLPTSSPGGSGKVWSDGGTLKIT